MERNSTQPESAARQAERLAELALEFEEAVREASHAGMRVPVSYESRGYRTLDEAADGAAEGPTLADGASALAQELEETALQFEAAELEGLDAERVGSRADAVRRLVYALGGVEEQARLLPSEAGSRLAEAAGRRREEARRILAALGGREEGAEQSGW